MGMSLQQFLEEHINVNVKMIIVQKIFAIPNPAHSFILICFFFFFGFDVEDIFKGCLNSIRIINIWIL